MFSASVVMNKAMITNKIRGCLLGALLGDCFGSPYEGEEDVSKRALQNYFDKLNEPYFKSPTKMYTDDTAMTKCICESLVENQELDCKDLAKKFVGEYFKEPNRGYGQNVVDVFHKLEDDRFEDVWRPAKEQFNGSGSYGNGGAMRVAPLALYFRADYSKMIEAARQATLITHTNRLGVNGALLQCIAVYLSLHQEPATPLDVIEFSRLLKQKIGEVEKNDVVDERSEVAAPYSAQLEAMDQLLQSDNVLDEQVQDTLGNSIAALYSVPTAIFCFLRAQKPIPNIKTDCPFRRTIQYAISLGGDTDTIASMAGAIAGAFYGRDIINTNLEQHCEFVDECIALADKIVQQTTSR